MSQICHVFGTSSHNPQTYDQQNQYRGLLNPSDRVLSMAEYAHPHHALPLIAMQNPSLHEATNADLETPIGASSSPLITYGSKSNPEDSGSNRLESRPSSDPTAELTTMAAYLTSLQKSTQLALDTDQGITGTMTLNRSASLCQRNPAVAPPVTTLRSRSQCMEDSQYKPPFSSLRVCTAMSQTSLVALRCVANDTARNAILTSCRRQRVLRKLAFLAGGLLTLYAWYYLSGTSVEVAWPVAWPLVWSH